MIKEEIKRYILGKTKLDVNIKPNDVNLHLTYFNLEHVVKIFNIWKDYIDTVEHKSIFLSNLINDLNTLGCCAVSGNPKSPCYLGSQANFVPSSSIPVTKYTSYQITGDHINQHLTSLKIR